MISPVVLEGIAKSVHDETGIEPPVDAFVVAKLCGIDVFTIGGSSARGDVERRAIWVGSRPRHVRRNGLGAHEVAHVLIADEGHDHLDEEAARYLAGALMLPRMHFIRDVGSTDWDLEALARIHVNVSAEMMVVRMTQVSPATSSVWDGGHLRRVYGNGEHDVEAARELVDQVLTLERPVRAGAKRAWPVFDGSFRRVLVVRAA